MRVSERGLIYSLILLMISNEGMEKMLMNGVGDPQRRPKT